MIFENIFVVTAYMNEGKNFDYPLASKPKVVILGAGWGGFNFGKFINKDEFEVILISPRNHFLFTPLLPSTTVGTLEYKCI